MKQGAELLEKAQKEANELLEKAKGKRGEQDARVTPSRPARPPAALLLGRRRAPEYVAYHDEEWGRPVLTDDGLFERLTLEAFQSGLSWLTILRKRPAFRTAFAGFDVAAVAAFDEADRGRLLTDAGIVRNRRKIEAASPTPAPPCP